MRKKLNGKGFTLIELLIVIIIIGILAAIAFVAYNGTQTKAHQSAAQETVSQARSKLSEYNANNGHYPLDQATFVSWLNDNTSTGGASPSLGSSIGLAATTGYTYTAYQSDSATSCSSDATTCAAYKIVADHTKFQGSTDITVTN